MKKFGLRKFWKASVLEDPAKYDPGLSRYEVAEEEGDYVGSLVDDDPFAGRIHWPAIDIDHHVWLRESSPGKFHLYIDSDVYEAEYWKLLDALVECGLVEPGYAKASKERGQTMLRKDMTSKYGPGATFTMDDSRVASSAVKKVLSSVDE